MSCEPVQRTAVPTSQPGRPTHQAVFRWTTEPPDLQRPRPRTRGHGLARGLIVQVQRLVLREAAVPTHAGEPRNTAPGGVADVRGFPDRHWTAFGTSKRLAVVEVSAQEENP